MSNKANVISSTRENIKKKKDNNHTKKFSYHINKTIID